MEGVDPRCRYTLAAGFDGLLTPSLVHGVSTGATVDLVVATAYGVCVRVVDAEGRPVRTSADRVTDSSTSIRHLEQDVTVAALPEWMMVFAGLDSRTLELGPFDCVLLFTDTDEPASVGPLEYSCRAPGYGLVREQFFATPLSSGLSEHAIFLNEASGFGHLEVSLAAGPRDPAPKCRSRSALQIVLTDAERSLVYAIRDASSEVRTIENIPAGRYSAFVRSATSLYRTPGEGDLSIEIRQEETTSVSLDLSDSGAVEAILYDEAHDCSYRGPDVFVVGQGAGAGSGLDRWQEVDFECSPYLIPGLAPDTYVIGTRFPKTAARDVDRTGVPVGPRSCPWSWC